MKKKTKSKLHLSDVFLILICLSSAIFFLYLFYEDLYSYTIRSDRKPIGEISFNYRTTQRKFDDRVVWERISKNAQLYNADTIRTAGEARTSIKFKDGTVLDLFENTMLQVFYDEAEGLKISISDGGIELDSSEANRESKVIFEDGSGVKVDSGTSLAANADTKSSEKNVEIKTGNAQISTQAGEAMDLTEGSSVNVSEKGHILKNPISVTYPPKELKILNTDDNEYTNVEFTWKIDTATPVIIQTSRLKNFSELLSDEIVNYSSSYTLEAPNGTIYWRVLTMYTIDNPIEGRIIIDNDTQMHSVSPVNKATYRYYRDLPRIKFRWSGNENASHYRLVVSSSRDMQNVVATREVQDAFLTLDTIREGTWYWQVTPYYEFNNIGYKGGSEISSFVVTKSEHYNPPELLVPSSNSTLFRKSDTALNATFAWKTELSDAKHTLLIARDELMDDLVFSETVSDNRFQKELDEERFQDGTYYWKIKRAAYQDEDEAESNVRIFKIAKYVSEENKLLYPPASFSAEASIISSTQFLWKLSDEYAKMQSVFQVSTTPDFTNLAIDKTQDNTFISSLNLATGQYYWRVGVKNEYGNTTAFTQERMFRVLKELDSPKIIFPKYNQEVVVLETKPVSIAWEQVKGADSYNVKIFDKDEKLISQKLSVKELSASFQLVSGSYIARVQAQSEASETSVARQGQESVSEFKVRSPEAIVLETPNNNEVIKGLTAVRQATYFSWQTGKDKAITYTFTLKKADKNGIYKEIESISTSNRTQALKRLEAGSYSWSISAKTKDDLPLDSKENFFTITEIPNLPTPVLLEPSKKLVMNETYLKAHRTITFRWRSIKDATHYDFELYKVNKTGKEIVLSRKKLRENQVRLSDLTLLDIGNFEWRVQAHSYARDGFEEEKSEIASSTFSISFEAPSAIETKETGSMYAQ